MAIEQQQAATIGTVTLLVESAGPGTISLFPGETTDGVIISRDEILSLSKTYADLYKIYIERMSVQLATHFNVSDAAASLLARRAVVPLIHCFLDRLVRMAKIKETAVDLLQVPNYEEFSTPGVIEEIENNAVSSQAFNQAMIGCLGKIWQLPKSKLKPVEKNFAYPVGFKNNIFRLYKNTPIHLAKMVLLKVLGKIPCSRFPALSMANAEGAFLKHGFYVRHLENVTNKWDLEIGEINHKLRKDIFTAAFIASPKLDRFLSDYGLNSCEAQIAQSLLVDFIQTNYPVSLLESISVNMQQALESLAKFKKKALITSGGRCTYGTFMVAAAKQKGFMVVGHQHGGHYGYLEDMVGVLELEYVGVDHFISWGWTRLPDAEQCKTMEVISLSSPWLSERKRFWSKLNIEDEREFDFLLMPNMVKRFLLAPYGASISRIDMVKDFSTSLKGLVKQVTASGVRILHKPYNVTTVNLISGCMKELDAIDGKLYSCEQQLDKGLTYDLLERCHVVLWDQPGTGFLECLSSGIPTMVYWPRIYSREEEWLEPIFSELKQYGIVHSEVDALVKEIKQFRKSPSTWMNDTERASLINRFCHDFARTSDDWPKEWEKYIMSLRDRRGANA